MTNNVLRNGLIIAGSLIAALLILKLFGVFGHDVANSANAIRGKV